MASQGSYRYDSDFSKRQDFPQLCSMGLFHMDVYVYTSLGSAYWSVSCARAVQSCGLVTLQKEEFTWGKQFQKIRVHCCHDRSHGSSEAGRCGTRAIAESSHLDPQARGRELTGNGWCFETSMPDPGVTSPLARPHLLIFLNRSVNRGLSFQTYGSVGAILSNHTSHACVYYVYICMYYVQWHSVGSW